MDSSESRDEFTPLNESLTEEVGVQKFGDEDDPERYHSANWYIGGRNNFELSTDALGGAKRGDAVRYTASRWSHTYHNTQEMEDDIKNLQTLIAEVKKLEAKGFVNSELNESLKEDLTVDEQAKVNEIVDQFLRDACAEIAVHDIDYKKENILKAVQAFVDDFFFMSESLNEDVNGELAMAELKDLVAMHIYNRFLESLDDNMAQEIAHRIPEYDVDWCNEEGDNFLANTIETKKKALARAITDALFANAPRELPECLTESDMPAEESENIIYKDSRRGGFYLWRNGKRYEAETIEKLKEILKSKDEDCKLKEGEVCPKCGKSPCECKECADTKLTEASEVIDRKGFATLIKYSDPVFANASHGVLNDGNFCYKFWAKDDDEAKKIFAERGTECDEVLTEDSTANYIVCAYTDDNYDYVDSWAFLKNADLDYFQLEDLQKVGDAWCGEDEELYWSFNAKDPTIKKFKKKDALKVCELLDQTDTRGMYLIPLSEKALEARLEEAEDGDFTESLEEGVKSELDYNEAVDFVEEAGISLDVAGSDFANYVIDDFEALEDENGKFSKADLKKFITYAKKKAKEFENEDLYEDLDTESLDKLISEKLGKTYVTESGYVDSNKITVEGKLGKEKVSYVFEAKRGGNKVALIGEKFALKGRLENKNIICEDIADSFKEIADALLVTADQAGAVAEDVEAAAEQIQVAADMIEQGEELESLEEATKMSEIKGTVGRIIKDKIFPRMDEISTKEELVKVAEEELAGVSDKAKGYAQEVLANLKKKNYSQAAVYLGNVMLAGENLRSPDVKKEELDEARILLTRNKVVDWLEDHEQAAEDCKHHLGVDDLEKADLNDILDWIADHETLKDDFLHRFGKGWFREALNSNFDEEKYGKYFTQDAEGNYSLIPEKADEYFDLLVKLWKEQDDKEVNEAFFINPTSLDGYEHGCVIKDDDGEYKFVTSHDEAHPVALFDTKEAAEEVAKKLAAQHTASKFPVVAESLLHEANLTEKKWEVRLESGKALRQAIDGEDGEEIKEALKNCYKEINRKMPEEFDEDELESMLDDLDMADFSENEEVGVDAEEAEDNVNAYLGDFYDFCDGYNIWVEI